MTWTALPELTFLVYIAVFIGVLLAFEGLRQFLSRSENATEARNRRMRMIAKGATTEQVLELLAKRAPERGFIGKMSRAVHQSGLNIKLRGLVALSLLMGAAVFAALSQVVPPRLAVPIAAGLAVLVPLMVVNGARTKRMEKLSKQLPEALDLMSRGLKVGHPLNVTIGSVAREMPDPIGTEFGIVEDQVSYGDALIDAFTEMAERLDTEDFRYLAVTVAIQHGTGGNLARVLQVLSKVIRDRATMRKKITAISAEGRFSALILSALPFAIFGMIMSTSPDFYNEVWDDPLFLPIMGTILTLVAAQAYILYRMVSFDF